MLFDGGQNFQHHITNFRSKTGEVISPVLFAIYVNDLLNGFKTRGCMFHGVLISAIMYADDLVLVTPSIYELQLMVNVCCNELKKRDLCINFDKSVAL
jgi:hypothetical protein